MLCRLGNCNQNNHDHIYTVGQRDHQPPVTGSLAGGSLSCVTVSTHVRTEVNRPASVIPAAGYTFTGWSGGLTGSTNPATITMDASKTLGSAGTFAT